MEAKPKKKRKGGPSDSQSDEKQLIRKAVQTP
jgi:hypothetical protein